MRKVKEYDNFSKDFLIANLEHAETMLRACYAQFGNIAIPYDAPCGVKYFSITDIADGTKRLCTEYHRQKRNEEKQNEQA